jgi:hypothetical protein
MVMVEQADWVAMRRRPVKTAKLPDAIDRANKLIDWYEINKPTVRRLAVTSSDYKAFEKGTGTHGIHLTTAGVEYRGFLIYVAP